MVRLIALTFIYICLVIPPVVAAEFTASVDRNQVAAGESFVLDLALRGASPQGRPGFDRLRESFTVHSQGQSSQTTIINNKVSSSVHWQFVLIPKQEGEITIPPIAIETAEGQLHSQPVKVTVTQAAAGDEADKYKSVFVKSEISKTNPYENEPVFLTAKLVSKRSMMNIEVPDIINVEGAIAKRQGDPAVYDGVLGGDRVKVVEAQYLITPLKSGKIVILPVTFKGQIQTDRPRGARDPFSMLDSFGFSALSYQPFAASGVELAVTVKPPEVQMDPWLPLMSLEIFDVLEEASNAKVGQPITRKIAIGAVGAVGASLPNLERQIAPEGHVRVYADKPETGENINPDLTISGWREERYTLIPQKSGTLTLPEIRVPWWDIKNGKVAYASVPARSIIVRPGPAVAENPSSPEVSAPAPDEAATAPASPLARPHNATISPAVYGIAVALAITALLLMGAVLHLLRKISRLQREKEVARRSAARPPANQDKAGRLDLKKAQTAEELRSFLQGYAHKELGLPRQAPLYKIAAEMERCSGGAGQEVRLFFSALDRALYAGAPADMAVMKNQIQALIRAARKSGHQDDKPAAKFSRLNPS